MKYLLYYKIYKSYRYLGYIERDSDRKFVYFADMTYHFGVECASRKKIINSKIAVLEKSNKATIEFNMGISRYMLKISENTDTIERVLSVELSKQ